MTTQIRVIPDSVTFAAAAELGIAEGAFPAGAVIWPGTGRIFILTLICRGYYSAVATAPLLAGQAHDYHDSQSSIQGGDGISILTWGWNETSLAAGNIKPSGGGAIITAGALTLNGSSPPADEHIWSMLTIELADEDVAWAVDGLDLGSAGTSFDIPASALTYAAEAELNVHYVVVDGTHISAVDSDCTRLAHKQLTRLNASLMAKRSASDTSYTHTLAAATANAIGQIFQFTEKPSLAANDGLPIPTPGRRSMDIKTIADRYNAGQPITPDYTWPNGRKFYQEPPETP